MADRNLNLPEKLIAVDILTFRNATRDISFDVYLKLSEDNVAHVFSRSTGLDYKRLAQYIAKGVKQLFIHVDDSAAYQDFISKPAHAIFSDPQTSPERKIATLLNMTEQNMSELFTQLDVGEETVESSKRVIQSYIELLTKTPENLALILKLVSHGEYLYYHSIAVSIFSMFIAKASGQFNQRMLELVGFGGFLHDIGTTQLPKELMESPMIYEKADRELMETHAPIGMKMLEGTTNIHDEVRYIVYQHHEQPNSKGYPNGLHAGVIYYPCKIVALADTFSALISKRPYRAAYTVPQAIEIMRAETVKGKYDRDLMAIVASVFLRQSKSAA